MYLVRILYTQRGHNVYPFDSKSLNNIAYPLTINFDSDRFTLQNRVKQFSGDGGIHTHKQRPKLNDYNTTPKNVDSSTLCDQTLKEKNTLEIDRNLSSNLIEVFYLTLHKGREDQRLIVPHFKHKKKILKRSFWQRLRKI